MRIKQQKCRNMEEQKEGAIGGHTFQRMKELTIYIYKKKKGKNSGCVHFLERMPIPVDEQD